MESMSMEDTDSHREYGDSHTPQRSVGEEARTTTGCCVYHQSTGSLDPCAVMVTTMEISRMRGRDDGVHHQP